MELRDRQVRLQQTKVEVAVLDLRQLYSQRKREGLACKETKRLLSAQARRRRKLENLLDELFTWSSITSVPAIRTSSVQVETMLKDGVMPWGSGGNGVAAAMLVMHGRRFHSALSDVARTSEEVVLLKVEIKRLTIWLHFVQKEVQSAIITKEASLDVVGGLAGESAAGPDASAGSVGQGAPHEGPVGQAPVAPDLGGAAGPLDQEAAAAVQGVAAQSLMQICGQDSVELGIVFLLKSRLRELAHMQAAATSAFDALL